MPESVTGLWIRLLDNFDSELGGQKDKGMVVLLVEKGITF